MRHGTGGAPPAVNPVELLLAPDASKGAGGDPSCRSRSVAAADVLVPVELTPQALAGRWAERWTVNRCGVLVPYVVRFDRAPDGDLDVSMQREVSSLDRCGAAIRYVVRFTTNRKGTTFVAEPQR